MANELPEPKPKEKPKLLPPYTPKQLADMRDWYEVHLIRQRQFGRMRNEYMTGFDGPLRD